MTKFSGLVGYGSQVETYPGVWDNSIREIRMRGDVIGQNVSITATDVNGDGSSSSNVNSDIVFKHRISLIGDAHAFDNWFNMKWVEIGGAKLKVVGVEVRRPRLIITLGGIWHD